MIDTVPFSGVSLYLCSTSDTIFKVFFMDYAERSLCLTIHFHTKEIYLFLIVPLFKASTKCLHFKKSLCERFPKTMTSS